MSNTKNIYNIVYNIKYLIEENYLTYNLQPEQSQMI
jgi:hypothetical protein